MTHSRVKQGRCCWRITECRQEIVESNGPESFIITFVQRKPHGNTHPKNLSCFYSKP
ncbi:hypothetical protein CP8484711_1838A, partial [Chlamydia psittaci 84-8471/1]